MNFNRENHVKNLPDCYNKSPDSNNAKILAIEQEAVNAIRESLREVYDSGDIMLARGRTLDLYGDMVGQSRGLAVDEQYRYMILLKIAQNISSGDYQTVAKALSVAFNCDPSEIYIEDSENPCSASLVKVPLGAITKSELTTTQACALIQRLLPICVILEGAFFEGTFEFSESETEYSEVAGFSEAEDGNIGGYLGVVYGDTAENKLPI